MNNYLINTPALDLLIEKMAEENIKATVGRTGAVRYVKVDVAGYGTWKNENPTYLTYYIFDNNEERDGSLKVSVVRDRIKEHKMFRSTVNSMESQFYKMKHEEPEDDE